MNVMKSAVHIVGIIGSKDMSPFRYLGMPLATAKKKLCILCRMDRITLSKLELIWVVLQGMGCLWMPIFWILAGAISKIIRCRLVLWGLRKLLVAWKDMCCTKEGGLNFWDLRN